MMPVYRRYADAYPFDGNQVPMMQYHHPNFGVIPPHKNADPSKSTVAYEPWLYASNNGYSAPCHGCCSHGNANFPGYYSFQPPYPHVSPPQFHWCGHHSTFPAHYLPPPYYPKEHPRYEYDKRVPRESLYHCCGCPNHTHNQINNERVKIEEQEPDGDRKGGNSLVQSQLRNYPYPIVWLPPDFMMNRSHRKPVESEMASKDSALQTAKPLEVQRLSGQEPKGWNGWFPIDIKNLGALSQGGDENQTQNPKNENKGGQLSFPIIWMPSQDKLDDTQMGKHEEKNATVQSAEQPSSVVKCFPVNFPGNINDLQKSCAAQENSCVQVGQEVKERNINQKTVPVKQIEAQAEEDKSEDTERKGRTVFPRKVEDNVTDKASVNTAKGLSASSPTTSKLPPVCLRVDPFRKKKNGSANSRSPSPPGSKGWQQAPVEDSSRSSASSTMKAQGPQDSQVKDNTLRSSKELEPQKKERRVIEVVESKNCGNKEEQSKAQSLPGNFQEEAVGNSDIGKAGEDDSKSKVEYDKMPKNGGNLSAEEVNEMSCRVERAESGEVNLQAERRVLSEEEAALVIQSAYRGYEVRKSEPLKKLKQIAQVREQVVELRNQIHDLESSTDYQNDKRQRAIVGEMIMGLLLKLDTIQGLHPSLRDTRKLLARELVTLQEKLDLLTQKSEGMAKSQPLFDSAAHPEKIMGMEEKQNEAGVQSCCGVSQVMDTKLNEGEEPSEFIIFVEEEHGKSANEEVSSMAGDSQSDGFPIGSQLGNGELCCSQETDTKNQQGKIGIKEDSKSPLDKNESRESRNTLQDGTCAGRIDEGKGTIIEENGLNKMLHGAVAEEPSAFDETNRVGRETMVDGLGSGVQTNISSDSNSLAGVDDLTTAAKCQQMDPVIELPLGVLNEEPKKQEKSEMWENDALGGDVVHDAGTETPSLQKELLTGCATEQHLVEAISEGLSVADSEKEDESQITELTLGVLDEERPEKHEKSEMQKNKARGEDMEHHAKTDAPSLQKELLTGCATEQDLVEVIDEGLSIADSDKEVNSQKDGCGVADASLGATMQEPQLMEVDADEERVKLSRLQEMQEVVLQMQNERSNAVQEEKDGQIGSADEARTGEGEDCTDESKPGGGNGGMTREEIEHHCREMISNSNGMEDLLDGSEAAEDSAVGLLQTAPTSVQNDEMKRELLPASSAVSQLSIDEQDFGMEGKRQLAEENAKLKEMMEKLIEAGREQLNVISNLTGRVNDLEKMLSRRNKKARVRRCGRTFSAASCSRPANESRRKKSIDVAS